MPPETGSSPRAVVDTNIFLSAFISPDGTPARVLHWLKNHGIILLSTQTLGELSRKTASPKFSTHLSAQERLDFLDMISGMAEFVTVVSTVHDSPDPKDNQFLALAIDGKADCIVSGDKKHLLALHPFRGIPILSPADFMSRFASSP